MTTANNNLVMTGASDDEILPLVLDHHYSRRMPAAIQHGFAWRRTGGLFGDTGEPVAVAAFGHPVNKHFADGIIELLRLVRTPEMKLPLSRFVCWTLRWMRQNTDRAAVISYADSAQNHHGGIYQACGFIYCGERGVPFDKVAGFKDERGKFWHARSVNNRFGTHQKDKIAKLQPTWDIVEALPKHFYMKPLRKQLRAILRDYEWEQLPYPKPNAAGPVDELGPPSVSQEHPLAAAPPV